MNKDLGKYYREKREIEYIKGIKIKGTWWRRLLHPLLVYLIKINRLFIEHQRIIILDDKRMINSNNKPVILLWIYLIKLWRVGHILLKV